MQDASSNATNVMIFNKGNCILQTEYNGSGDIKKLYVNFYDHDGNSTYTYVDTNGDGLFDFFLVHNPPGDTISNITVFVRSNYTWVRRQEKSVGIKP
jgi:hypothetical protein